MAYAQDTDYVGPNPAGEYAIVNESGSVIARVFPRTILGDPEDAKANARLWAAAPDLLNACYEARRVLQHRFASEQINEVLSNAITKAEAG